MYGREGCVSVLNLSDKLLHKYKKIKYLLLLISLPAFYYDGLNEN